jgi:hypothetical protein
MMCRECLFFRTDARFLTTCHRYAPRLDAILMTDPDLHEKTHFGAKWPEVPSDEWCGDFEPAAEEARTSEPRAQVPAELPSPPKPPKPVAPPKPLPTAKEAVEMVIEYLTISVCDYDESALVIDKQTLAGSPEGKVWRIEARYDENDYNFVIGPDGIVEMY